jgi:hypothetical protein
MNNEYPLLIGTPNVFGHIVEGKYFKDLPEEIKHTIEEETIEVIILEDATVKEIEEMFYRLNNGTALTKVEKLRSQLGDKFMSEIQKFTSTEFFKTINITENQRNGSVDEWLVLEILSLEMEAQIGFTSDEVEVFAMNLKAIDEDNPNRDTEPVINKEVSDDMFKKIEYLTEAMKEIDAKSRSKKTGAITFFSKNNIPPIYLAAEQAMNREWTPKQFADELVKFYKKVPFAYANAKSNGTASKANVMTRIEVLLDTLFGKGTATGETT